MRIFTRDWLRAAAIRAIKTVAQTAVGIIGFTTVFSEVDWITVGGGALLAGVVSLLTSLAGLPEVKSNDE